MEREQFSLVDYGGLGDSDIEDSDEETPNSKPVRIVPAARARPATKPIVKTSSRLVSYEDVVEEEEEFGSPKARRESIGNIENTGEDPKLEPTETSEDGKSNVATQKSEEESKQELRIAKVVIQLPPEPPGRCSIELQDKIASLLEKKSRQNMDLNARIQGRKDFRNPSIYEKLVSFCNLNETGTNYPKSLYDPSGWKEESFYENLAKAQIEAHNKITKERSTRAQIEFVSGMKKPAKASPATGEPEAKKRKSKWDVPGVAIKTATPPKVGALVPGIGLAKLPVDSAVKRQ